MGSDIDKKQKNKKTNTKKTKNKDIRKNKIWDVYNKWKQMLLFSACTWPGFAESWHFIKIMSWAVIETIKYVQWTSYILSYDTQVA